MSVPGFTEAPRKSEPVVRSALQRSPALLKPPYPQARESQVTITAVWVPHAL